MPASVMAANAKSGFGLRWGKGTIAKVSNDTGIASRGATAGEGQTIQLSVRKEGGEKKDYSRATAMQVSASTLAHLIPEKGVQEAIPSDAGTLGATKAVQYAPKKFAHMLRTRGLATIWMLRYRITLAQSK